MSMKMTWPALWPPRRIGSLVPAMAVLAAALGNSAISAPVRAEFDVNQEIECLALTIYFEARGEPDEGKLAVGHVVLNRALHPLFPEEVCGVVRQGGAKRYRCQFTWWCDGRSDRPKDWAAWERSKDLARHVFWHNSSDPTEGALWYHAEYVLPAWHNKLNPGPKIGRHIFYRPAGKTPHGPVIGPGGGPGGEPAEEAN